MAQLNINAPIMVVRGDGSLMQADYAQERPVETILSGPAASIMGAKFLSGCKDCLVVDMGGTTTDIAYLHAGQCTISDEGAQIAGWHTKVRALQICTFGLGGDSKIQADNTVKIGPQRVIPLCRGSAAQGDTGLTPTDILHVTGEYQQWDTMRAKAGLQQAAGKLGLDTAQQAAQALKEKTEIQLAAYCQQGMRAFGAKEIPMLLGVGAPAQTWLPEAAVWLGIPAEIPPFAEVANAVGATTGQIRETAHAMIRPNKLTQEYMLYTEEGRHTVSTLEEAQQKGFALARQLAAQKAKRAGAKQFETKTATQVSHDASGALIEQRIQVLEYGYPR